MASCPHGVQQPGSFLITGLLHSTVRKHCEEHSLAPCCPMLCSGRGPTGQSAQGRPVRGSVRQPGGTGAAWEWAARPAALIPSCVRGEQARSYMTCWAVGIACSWPWPHPATGPGCSRAALLCAARSVVCAKRLLLLYGEWEYFSYQCSTPYPISLKYSLEVFFLE